tara:strand:+ start:66 stop:527 length:462 start_codon:yes stop_codon:yes gene_type:complete
MIYSFNLSAEDISKKNDNNLKNFMSIKTSKANMRVGPSEDYPIILQYRYKNLPLKILGKYENWLQVSDWKNNRGWMHISLLSNKRSAVINKSEGDFIDIFNKPNSKKIGKIGNGNVLNIKKCIDLWCLASIKDYKGWVKKDNLWGIIQNEQFD